MALVTSHRNYQWLHNLIAGDEKWVLYVHHTRKYQWVRTGQTSIATSKNDLHPRKIMLSVWRGVRRITHWKLLPNECNITADLYCQQLDCVAAKLQRKQDKIYFLHDNTRPHVAKSIREKLLKVGWITIPHPPYSPDLAPTDYHLYHFLSDYLREKKIDDENDLKMDLIKIFGQKSRTSTKAGLFPCQSVGDRS